MKNLKASLIVSQSFPDLTGVDLISKGQDSHEVDLSKKTGFIYALKGSNVFEVSLSKNYSKHIYDLKTYYAETAGIPTIPRVVGFAYNYVTNSLVISLENGDLLDLLLDSKYVECQCVCTIEVGLRAMEWSPDQENVLLLTNDSSLLLMNANFEVLNEIFLLEPGEGEQQFITVGWGKKETQFHGSEGKQAAVAPSAAVDPSIVHDEHNASISWRGDSALFAIGFWCTKTNMRRVKIFNREGILQCVSENLTGLEEPIAWRPSGNLIGLTQCLPNKYVIAFMEKNGLKHGEFTLPNNIKVNKLLWNADSSILGMVTTDKDSKTESLLLWTTGNYHWYLKQRLVLESTPVCLLWDDSRGNRMHGVYNNGTFFTIEWTWVINHTQGYHLDDPAYVAVIDHEKVLLTSFKEAIIPPPMSGWTLDCPSAVNQVLLLKNCYNTCNEGLAPICAVLHNDEVAFFSKTGDGFVFTKKCGIKWPEKNCFLLPCSLNHWLWLSPSTFLLCGSLNDHMSAICFLELNEENLTVRDILHLEGTILVCSANDTDILIQTTDGNLYLCNTESRSVVPHGVSLPEPCYRMEYIDAEIFCLSELNRLYINNIQMSSIVSSFLFHKPYLLATTTHHSLIVLNPDLREEISLRKLERGSKLIVATGNSVVMQLPRGNLETIQPRALTILTAGQLINEMKYKDAMTLLRRQRIDLNLCVDHNLEQFVATVDTFVEQVDPQWITLLITELSSVDVTKDAYAAYYNQKALNRHQKVNKTKVETICTVLYNSMTKANRDYYILPILSCLVKTKKMRQAIELANTDDSLRHLLFLVDVDHLYTEALGAYNLEAAVKIAGKSQKDPKEYIPFLNSLRLMEPNFMKYTIDKSLGRFESALVYIAQCNDVDKVALCFQLIKEHSLYRKALEIFKDNKERYKETSSLYADYLFKSKYYEDAGIMYIRSENFEKAIKAFVEIGQWRQCMVLAKRANYDEASIKKLAVITCSKLYSSQQYSEAAQVYLQYLSDVEHAIESYTKGKKWQEAIYVAESHGTTHLKESIIKKYLMEALESLTEDIKSKMEKVQKYTDRLVIVRAEKLRKNDVHYIDEINDTQSEISSVTSVRSSVSRSSKNTRKSMRKMWSLKEGNPREEQALVATLAQIIQSSEKLTGEVRTTCLTLLYFNEDDEALVLQLEMKNLLLLIEKTKPTIWPKENDEIIDPFDQQLKFPPASTIHPGWEIDILKQET